MRGRARKVGVTPGENAIARSRLSALTGCCVQSYRKGISSVGAQERCIYPVRVRSGAHC